MTKPRRGRPRTRNQRANAAINDARLENKCLLVLKLIDPRFANVMEPLADFHTGRRKLSKSRAFLLVAEMSWKETAWALRAPHEKIVNKLCSARFLRSNAPWTTVRDYFEGFIGTPAAYKAVHEAVDERLASGMPYLDACREVGNLGIRLRERAPKVYMSQSRVQTFYRKFEQDLPLY